MACPGVKCDPHLSGSLASAHRGRALVRRVCAGIFLACVASLASGLLSPAQAAWDSIDPSSSGAAPICVRVGEDEARYFPLDSRQAVEFSLQGPGRLRTLTRHLPRDGRTAKRCYTVVIEMDGQLLKSEPQLSVESSSAVLCGLGGGPVGSACETLVRFPEGRHSFRVKIEEPGKEVAARFFKERKTAATSYVGFAPEEFERVCTLVEEDGKEYGHYHFSPENPLRFTVNGPTSLLLRTRLDFSSRDAAGTPVDYSLEVRKRSAAGGAWEPAVSIPLTSGPVLGSAYKECAQIVPGESRKSEIEIPEGVWTFEIRAVTGGRGIAARILIPKDDIGLGS
ncbi:MAG: hypothetical protein KBD56_00640 [Candidatus Eisenbacteria bacterium]|nr:hypothetical protein [Candidatus Eisenbacteria bacterium]